MATRRHRAAVIPARFASTRFPGKPLALLAGKPMVVHVLERVHAAALFDTVCVATDDARIAAAVGAAGGEARLTSMAHRTGTERVAEVAAAFPSDAWVYNVQGDEPLLPPALLGELVRFVESQPQVEMATAAHPSAVVEDFHAPQVVKVVTDAAGKALYFSRAPLPHDDGGETTFLHHIGLYAFQRQTLLRFVSLAPGPLERRENLEQLRALEHGIPIHVLVTAHATRGVDTPADLKAVATRLQPSLESPGVPHI